MFFPVHGDPCKQGHLEGAPAEGLPLGLGRFLRPVSWQELVPLPSSAQQTVLFFVMGEPGGGGGVGAALWMPSASGVHRGRLKTERPMRCSKGPLVSRQEQIWIFEQDYDVRQVLSGHGEPPILCSLTWRVLVTHLLSARPCGQSRRRGSLEGPGLAVVGNLCVSLAGPPHPDVGQRPV